MLLVVTMYYMKVMVIKLETVSVGEYFSKIRPYLCHLIEEYSIKGPWKIQLTAKLSSISLTDTTVRQKIIF